jgi:hypothetical protein
MGTAGRIVDTAPPAGQRRDRLTLGLAARRELTVTERLHLRPPIAALSSGYQSITPWCDHFRYMQLAMVLCR